MISGAPNLITKWSFDDTNMITGAGSRGGVDDRRSAEREGAAPSC